MQNLSLSNLIISLEKSTDILKNFINEIPVEDLSTKRLPNAWSVQHHVFHLADVQGFLYERLARFKHEKNPVFVPYIPQKDEKTKSVYTSVPEAFSAFENWRQKQLELIKTLDDPDLQNEGVHPEYKRYNAMMLIRHILMHDYWHMYRIEELWLTTDAYLSGE